MKMSKIFSLILVVVMLFSVTSCDVVAQYLPEEVIQALPEELRDLLGLTSTPPVDDTDLTGTYNVKLWVSEKTGVAELTQSQIDAFEAANPGIVINAEIEGVSEANAAGQVLNDVASAPDIYCFAQDQLARLVQASALAPLGEKASATVRENNDAGSVGAGSVGGKLYAYPMTSDNGYYLYYDTSIITNPESLEDIIAACEANGVKFRYGLENAWFMASFFFATGCESTFTMNDEGKFTSVTDTFNSPEGLIAMKGMQKLAQSSCYDSDNNVFTDAGAIVTGIWNAESAENHFGANLGATDLPSFTVDGQSYHLGSFTGNKLMGVKPQTDVKKAAVLQLLAQWLTNEQCQKERFAEFQWGPSNKNAQATPEVQSNISLAALAKQGDYGRPEANIHGSWWDIAAVLGADAKSAKSESDLQTSLAVYEAAIKALLEKTEDEIMAWSVIGAMQDTAWKVDFAMEKVSDGVWQTKEAIEFKVGDTYKLRRGAAWDVQVGADGQMKTPEIEPANFVSDVAGKYHVRLEWDGTSTIAKVTLIPAN